MMTVVRTIASSTRTKIGEHLIFLRDQSMLGLLEPKDEYIDGNLHIRSIQCRGHKDQQHHPSMVLAIFGIQELSQAVVLLAEA